MINKKSYILSLIKIYFLAQIYSFSDNDYVARIKNIEMRRKPMSLYKNLRISEELQTKEARHLSNFIEIKSEKKEEINDVVDET